MRLISNRQPDNPASAYELADFYFPETIAAFLERGEPARKALAEVLAFARRDGDLRGPGGEKISYGVNEVRILPPLLNPEKTFVIGFSDKARTEAMPKAEIPTGYYKLPQTFVASGAPIVWPKFSEEVDADACLAIVIGKAGRRIPPEKAWDHVAGVTLMVDITARDINRREGLTTNNLLGKNFPSSTCIGPGVLLQSSREELENVEVELSLDGAVKQKFALRDCVFTVEQIIARWSILGIKPGDWLAIGASMAMARRPAAKSRAAQNRLDDPLLLAGDRRTVAPSRRSGRRASMKLVTFLHHDQERIGAVDNSGPYRRFASGVCGLIYGKSNRTCVGDRLAAIVLGRDMVEFLKRGEKAFDAARKALAHAEQGDSRHRYSPRPRAGSSQIACAAPRRAGICREKFFRSRRRDGVKKGPRRTGGISQATGNGDRPRRRYPASAGSKKFRLRSRARHRHRQTLRRRERGRSFELRRRLLCFQ